MKGLLSACQGRAGENHKGHRSTVTSTANLENSETLRLLWSEWDTINKCKQQKRWDGQVSCLIPLNDFWLQSPRPHNMKFSRCSPSHFSGPSPPLTSFSIKVGVNWAWGWICYTASTTSSAEYLWMVLEDKELPLVSYNKLSPSPSLLSHAPSPGFLSMPLHTDKAEALAIWYYWKCWTVDSGAWGTVVGAVFGFQPIPPELNLYRLWSIPHSSSQVLTTWVNFSRV